MLLNVAALIAALVSMLGSIFVYWATGDIERATYLLVWAVLMRLIAGSPRA